LYFNSLEVSHILEIESKDRLYTPSSLNPLKCCLETKSW